jgi:hypothetical protein
VWQSREDWHTVMEVLDVTEVAMEQVEGRSVGVEII